MIPLFCGLNHRREFFRANEKCVLLAEIGPNDRCDSIEQSRFGTMGCQLHVGNLVGQFISDLDGEEVAKTGPRMDVPTLDSVSDACCALIASFCVASKSDDGQIEI
jgi:hypothetical protein